MLLTIEKNIPSSENISDKVQDLPFVDTISIGHMDLYDIDFIALLDKMQNLLDLLPK